MAKNSLYRLQRSQKYVLKLLAICFLFLSFIWVFIDLIGYSFPIEPFTVVVGGFATLFASYWPFKAKSFSVASWGRRRFDHESNNGEYSVGEGDSIFVLKFSPCSDSKVYLCTKSHSRNSNVESLAKVGGCGRISEIADCESSGLDYSSGCIGLAEGDVAILKNEFGAYCALQIVDVRDPGYSSDDDRYEVVFEYRINPKGVLSFSE